MGPRYTGSILQFSCCCDAEYTRVIKKVPCLDYLDYPEKNQPSEIKETGPG